MKKILSVSILSLIIMLSTLIYPAGVSASFSKSNLMSDDVFNNKNSMTVDQINSFLNSFPNSCISPANGFRAVKPTGYNPTDGFLFGSKVKAGRVIYEAAQAYNLNPQVLLATLQKEQSLVNGNAGCHPNIPNPPGTYKCDPYSNGNTVDCVDACHYSGGCTYVAMGYDCPYRCAKRSVGFSKQVIKAAWRLKFNQQRSLGNINWAIIKGSWDNSDDPQSCYDGPMTRGYHQVCPSGSTVYYDGYRIIQGESILMQTGATASLYSYTPFFHGNQLFVNIFESWFGSTRNSRPYLENATHPDGTLIKDPGDNAIYQLRGQERYHIPSLKHFASHNFKFSQVRTSTPSDSELPLNGSDMAFRSGSLVTSNSTRAIYLLNCTYTSCAKRHIISADVFKSLGYVFSDVISVSGATLSGFSNGDDISTSNRHYEGTLVSDGNGKVYLIEDGKKRWIKSLGAFSSNNFRWDRVQNATDADLALSDGPDVDFYIGSLIKTESSSNIYAVDYVSGSPVRRHITTYRIFLGLGYNKSDVYVIKDSELPPKSNNPIVD